MNSLVHYLQNIEDYRHRKGKRHQPLPTLYYDYGDDLWLSGATSHRPICQTPEGVTKRISAPTTRKNPVVTLQRLSKGIDFTQVIHCFNEWMSQSRLGERIAIDGKSINSTVSASQETDQNFVSLVSFFSQNRHLIVKIGAFENHQTSEISVVQELLSQFDLTKAVFTLDALHCQKKRYRPSLRVAMAR